MEQNNKGRAGKLRNETNSATLLIMPKPGHTHTLKNQMEENNLELQCFNERWSQEFSDGRWPNFFSQTERKHNKFLNERGPLVK